MALESFVYMRRCCETKCAALCDEVIHAAAHLHLSDAGWVSSHDQLTQSVQGARGHTWPLLVHLPRGRCLE